MSSLREDVGTAPDAVSRGVVTVALNGRVIAVDDSACATLGFAEEALAGTRLTDLLHLDDAPGERRYVRPDGRVAWLLVQTEVVGEPPECFRVHVRDVTTPRVVAHAEREVSERYHVPIEGSWVLDARGRTLAISPSTAALLGYTPDEMRDRSPLDFVADEDARDLRDALHRRQAGMRESYEVRWLHRDGSAVWALMSAAPILDHDGRYAGAFALVTDVTAQRHADERLERQARQATAIAELGRRALEGVDTHSVFDHAVRATADALRVDWTGLFQLEGDRLRLVAVHGLPAGTARDLELRRTDEIPVDQLTDGTPIVVHDWETDRRVPRPAYAAELGVRGAAVVPIAGRRVHGLLGAGRSVPWRPGEDELRYLQTVANVLAAALDRAEAEEQGRVRAMQDVLTGLPNRTLALDRIDQALRRRAGDDTPLVVVAVDLDRFKRINDTFGVAAGDAVVQALARRLRALVSPADTVARLAGDTLLVVSEDLADEAAAGALAARIVEALRTPVHVAGEQVRMTVSVGVAIAGREEEAGDLIRDAEAAVERAKAHGRDRFELFDPELRARAADRVALERDLRGAAERGELFVAHQPIVSVGGGQITGTEALVRWRHPQRGVIPPGDFIGIAEESGLIADIGTWVLGRACADVAERIRGGKRLTCHVNLSPRQMADPRLPDVVAGVLRDTALPAEALVLEITESSLMEAGAEPLCIMQSLRELGVRLVLDDFGTGYSSLARLRSFPIDGLKIDRSFVAALDGSEPADALIVAGIVELARALALTVVAEGVETVAQLDRLKKLGCLYAQGFLLARPAACDELDRLLALGHLLPRAAVRPA